MCIFAFWQFHIIDKCIKDTMHLLSLLWFISKLNTLGTPYITYTTRNKPRHYHLANHMSQRTSKFLAINQYLCRRWLLVSILLLEQQSACLVDENKCVRNGSLTVHLRSKRHGLQSEGLLLVDIGCAIFNLFLDILMELNRRSADLFTAMLGI